MADPNNFSNILSAMQGNQQAQAIQSKVPGNDLNLWSKNYDMFTSITNQGISLEDLLAKISTMDAEIKELKTSKPKEPSASFVRMERAVKDNPLVVAAKQKIADERNRIITEICSKDEKFVQAVDAYKQAVNDAYVARVEDDIDETPTKKRRAPKPEPEPESSD